VRRLIFPLVVVAGAEGFCVIDWEYPLGMSWPLSDFLYFVSSTWSIRYRKGPQARADNYRRLFFEKHGPLPEPLGSRDRHPGIELRDLRVEIDRALQVADAQQGVQDSHHGVRWRLWESSTQRSAGDQPPGRSTRNASCETGTVHGLAEASSWSRTPRL
jgi:hypothetical protein